MKTITLMGQLYSAKNTKQIINLPGRRPMLVDASWVKKNERVLKAQLVAKHPEWKRATAGLSFPLCVKLKIYRQTKQRFDYINICQQLADMMVKCNWLPDDNADCFVPVFDQYEVDKKNPRVELTVLGGGDSITLTKSQISLL